MTNSTEQQNSNCDIVGRQRYEKGEGADIWLGNLHGW